MNVLSEPAAGVLVFRAAPPTWEQTLYAAVLSGGPGAVASFDSAAALHLLDGFRLDGFRPGPIHVTTDRTRVTFPGVTLHRTRHLPSSDRVFVRNIPCTGLARTMCDVGATGDRRVVLRALDDCERRGVSLRWLEHTALAAHRPGQRGTRLLLDLLDERSALAVPGSWFERLLHECLTSTQLAGMVRQHIIRDASGDFVARVDLALPPIRLGIEGHSRRFHVGRMVEAYDEDRDIRAAKAGWEIVYLGHAATRSARRVRCDIEAIADRRRHDLRLVPPDSRSCA